MFLKNITAWLLEKYGFKKCCSRCKKNQKHLVLYPPGFEDEILLECEECGLVE